MKRNRNVAVSALKLIASIFVVFIHAPFPGDFGSFVNCAAKFAVPVFFCISGYYAYRVSADRLVPRLKKMGLLALVGYSLGLIWKCCYMGLVQNKSVQKYLTRLLSAKNLSRIILMEKDPIVGHLWYLSVMLVIYIVFILYTRFWKKPEEINYKPLYQTAACGFLFFIAFSMKFPGVKLTTSELLHRNSLFFGFPMFALGLFLAEYGDRIVTQYALNGKKAVALIALGLALSLLQWNGIAKTSMPVGMLPVVIVLVLGATRTGRSAVTPRGDALCRCAETTSMVVYLSHRLIHDIISSLWKKSALYSNKALYPLFIVAVSVALGVCVWLIQSALSKRRGRAEAGR